MNTKEMILITGVVLSLSLGSACAKSPSETPASVAKEPEAPAPVAPAPVEKSKPGLSEGMKIPVDGSSLEAFNKSLETIKGKTVGTEYKALTGAIAYLQVYDLKAKGNRATLAKHLDGLTGEQIIAKVRWDPAKRR